MTLYCEQLGQGQSLVLLHGWGFHTKVWAPFLPKLTTSFRVSLIDLPGFGMSDALSYPMMSAQWIDSIATHIPEGAIILGWSLGGLVATQLAVIYPKKVSSVIHMASTPKFMAGDTWAGIAPEVLQAFEQAIETNPRKGIQQFCRWLAPDLKQRALYKALLNIAMVHSDKLDILLEALKVLKNTDMRQAQLDLEMPQLFIDGNQDPLVPYQKKGNNHVLISDAGHVPFLTHPQQCLQAMQEFCYVAR